MAETGWERATFAGASAAKARDIALLPAAERVKLLEALLDVAAASGALRKAREAKQQAIDALWSS